MPQHVLVVDDWSAIRTLTRVALEHEGHIVAEAEDGAMALERLLASPERLVVLLDCQMPRLNGMQVMEAVAAHETLLLRHAYVMLTAVGEFLPVTFKDLLAQLGVPLITKPFDLCHLLYVVAHAAAKLESDGRRI